MLNPWVNLPDEEPFVLPCDDAGVRAFNATATNINRLRLDVMPEPYLGDPTAPLVLLNKNPGFAESEVVVHKPHSPYSSPGNGYESFQAALLTLKSTPV